MRVTVLGGGLMGTAAAYFLAKRGAQVTLIERGRIGAGATTASFGNIRRSGRHLAQLPLAARALDLWGGLQERLGVDVEFRATGHLRLIFEPKALADMRAYQSAALGPAAIGASLSEQDGSANPRLIAPAFAKAAALGAQILDGYAPLTIAQTAAGFRVETAQGAVGSDALLNCAGAWGGEIAAQFGEVVPIETMGPQMGVTEPLPYRIAPVVGIWTRNPAQNGYFRQVERGNIVFGGAAARSPVGPSGHAKARPAALPAQLRALVRLMPALAQACVIRTWSGPEGYVADGLPVMGASARAGGLFHAFGFCGHGFQLGPAVGETMAELILTGATSLPIAPFSIARFGA